jgi:8-oxo-dGTP pyrophosphatase MutT (NUDIX family)
MRVVRKAIAYVTWGGRVLFFRAIELPDHPAELPGGMLEADEEPEAGVLREAREETGLHAFGAPRRLGVLRYDPKDGKNEVHERHFFHLPLLEHAPEVWKRVVEEGNGTFTFSFFWVDRSNVPERIYPGHDAFLRDVLDRESPEAEVPEGARPVARVLVLSNRDRVLLLCAAETGNPNRWWVAPGGGLDDGETFERAARREVAEETGISCDVGPWVWTRRHIYVHEGVRHDQYERFFVAANRVQESEVRGHRSDSYVVGSRWWSLADLVQSSDDFAPRRLAELLRPILEGRFPGRPIDCGI